MTYKKDSVNHFIHKQQYNIIDLLSYAGGILGLLAGFSFLSFVELIYWFTIRVVIKNFHRSTQVFPFDKIQETQKNFKPLKNMVLNFLKSSSIHGMVYISKRNIFDKY